MYPSFNRLSFELFEISGISDNFMSPCFSSFSIILSWFLFIQATSFFASFLRVGPIFEYLGVIFVIFSSTFGDPCINS